TYEELTLIPAIKNSLASLDYQKLLDLKKAHTKTFQADLRARNLHAVIPFSDLGSGIKGKVSTLHSELVILFSTLFLEKDSQKFDAGIRLISEWMEKNPVDEIDSYLEYRLLPACLNAVRIDQETFSPLVFKIRMYFIGQLIVVLRRTGAELSATNSAITIWELIDACSRLNGMAVALDSARSGLDAMLDAECQSNRCISYLMRYLTYSIERLAQEHNANSLNKMAWLLDRHKIHFTKCLFRIWPKGRENIDNHIQAIKLMYETIEKEYGKDLSLWAEIHDMRFWILVTLRIIQKGFVNSNKPNKMEEKTKTLASQDFTIFDTTISELLNLRQPKGDKNLYIKNPVNPYIGS
ncbi:hypothetical protein C6A37_03645, partial [Desulfobacteraceae bacterium SEEP-SAG9]